MYKKALRNSELVQYLFWMHANSKLIKNSIIKYYAKKKLLSGHYSNLQLALEKANNVAGIVITYSENYWLKQRLKITSN